MNAPLIKDNISTHLLMIQQEEKNIHFHKF